MDASSRDLVEELDIGDEFEDVTSSRHQPRASVFATLLPFQATKKLSHIYVRNQFPEKQEPINRADTKILTTYQKA